MNDDDLLSWIKSHEGFRAHPYQDTEGFTTIGYGRNLSQLGISHEEAEMLLDNDILRCKQELSPFLWYYGQPPNVRDALVNMCFNLGITKLLGFKRMIAALENKDYTKASIEALDSRWAQQVHQRAVDVATMIREGK